MTTCPKNQLQMMMALYWSQWLVGSLKLRAHR